MRETGAGVQVVYRQAGGAEREELAAACVIAVPAPEMLRIHETLDPFRRNIAQGIAYTVAVGVHFGLASAPPDEPAILLQVPRTEHPDLSAIMLDHNKARGRTAAGKGLLATYWQHDWGLRQWDRGDAAIAVDATAALGKVMPKLIRDIEFTHVQRWRQGFVMARTGSYRERAGFQRGGAQSRVQLAGDYFSSPSTHSSLCAGESAARALSALLRPGSATKNP